MKLCRPSAPASTADWKFAISAKVVYRPMVESLSSSSDVQIAHTAERSHLMVDSCEGVTGRAPEAWLNSKRCPQRPPRARTERNGEGRCSKCSYDSTAPRLIGDTLLACSDVMHMLTLRRWLVLMAVVIEARSRLVAGRTVPVVSGLVGSPLSHTIRAFRPSGASPTHRLEV